MAKIQRIDRSGELLKPHWMPDGSAWFEGRAATPGVHIYYDSQGREIRELVTAETLGRREDLATLGGAPVTVEHPPEFVSPDNFRQYAAGQAANEVETEEAGGFVRVKSRIMARDALDAIRSGKVELSCGYVAEIDYTPGEHPEFGRYDQQQISREYNHLAIVDRGRHGREVRLRVDGRVQRIDGADPWQIVPEPATNPTDTERSNMLTRATLLPLIFACLPPPADAGNRADHEGAATKLADSIVGLAKGAGEGKTDGVTQEEYDALVKERDKLKADIKAMKAKGDSAPDPAALHALAVERSELLAKAGTLKIKVGDSAANDEIKRQIVTAVRGDSVAKDAEAPVIEAHWQIIRTARPEQGQRVDAETEAKADAFISPMDELELRRDRFTVHTSARS